MTGWIGLLGMNAPIWKERRNFPLVVVPSGNNRTRGNLLQEAFLCKQVLENTILYQMPYN